MSGQKETEIRLTESEIETLLFYVGKSLIDAEGLVAIGYGNPKSVRNLRSIRKKAEKASKRT